MQQQNKQAGTWKYGIFALCVLAPFFFLTYGFANQHAASLPYVPSLVFNWEKYIPLWSWTIVPYWSIDLFYGLSLILCWNKFELKQHTLRLLSAQLIAVFCFLTFPFKFEVQRPELEGIFGTLFNLLMGFDLPFNQAPSLHIILVVILWDFYRRHLPSAWQWLVHFWSGLIALSVLTTWQHHFIDVPTGLLVGALCLWLFPLMPQQNISQNWTFKHFKLGSYYFIASLLFLGLAWFFKSYALWLLYPALSLFLVSCAYFTAKPTLFQKQLNGQLTIASKILFAPYITFAWLNSRIWTQKHPEDSLILKHHNHEIYLGRIPNKLHVKKYTHLLDCCAELSVQTNNHYAQCLILDLIPLQHHQIAQGVKGLDILLNQSAESKTLIFCALGYSRSTCILLAWLVKNHYATTPQEALKIVQKARPWVVISEAQLEEVSKFMQVKIQ